MTKNPTPHSIERDEREKRFLEAFRRGDFVNERTGLQNPYEIEQWWNREMTAVAQEARIEKDDLLSDMWGLICNVNGGIIENEKEEWYQAFLRIREKYFTHLSHTDDKTQTL